MARPSGEEDKSRAMVVSSTTRTRTRTRGVGYCYTDDDDIVAVPSTNLPTNIQTNHLPSIIINHTLQQTPIHQQLYHLTSSLPMDHHHHHDPNSLLWKGFFNPKPNNNSNNPGPSSSKNHFYHHPHHQEGEGEGEEEESGFGPNWNEQNRLVLVDDSSLRCVFPCEANERPSQGLSLSLSSANPSSIGLQSFELIRHNQQQQQEQEQEQEQDGGDMDDQFRLNIQQNQHIQLLDGLLGKTTNLHHHHHQEGEGEEGEFQIRNSKYMGPARELLNEFCDLGGGQQQPQKTKKKKKKKPHRSTTGSGSGTHWQEEEEGDDDDDDSSSRKAPLCSTLQLLELQKRKSKLLSMLQEVDRRYRQYCDEMKAVVSGFEAVAGEGAGKVYSALASRAMSTHFRCLRDGIASQIRATRKAMGDDDKDSSGVGTRGETPRLRLLDQSFRQQRAFQQMTMMEAHPWRPQRGLPERSVSLLRAWLFEHFLHPYPSDVDKHILARQTGLSRSQVSNWFINARVRLWKPMVEEMYLEETKDHQIITIPSSSAADNNNTSIGFRGQNDPTRTHIQIPHPRPEDQKPTSDQLVRIDSECLSSIINNNNHRHRHHPERSNHEFGAVELDFSAAGSYGGGGGGGVSLTLGLQNNSGGVSLEFSEAAASQSSLLYSSRDHHIDHNHHHHHHDQYSSLLDTTESQNLPYRNLMGAQLLHDLAG